MSASILPSEGCREKRHGHKPLRLYLLLSCMMMLYKGSTSMYKTTLNHHLYTRFLHNILHTNFTGLIPTDNSTWITNICYPNQSIKTDRDFAQELADKHQTFLLSVASSISLVTLIIFGVLSDAHGRKFILLSATLSFSVQCIVVAVFIQNEADTSLYYIPYVIDGIGGSMFGFNLGCFLVMADTVRSKRERGLGLALIESLNGVGSITTEYSTAYLIKRYGVTLPVILATIAVLVVFVMVLILLPKRTVSYVKGEHNSKSTSINSYQSNVSHDSSNQPEAPVDNLTQSESNIGTYEQNGFSIKTFLKPFVMFYFSNKYYGKRKTFWACLVIFCLVESPIVFRSDLIALIQIGWPNCWPTRLANDYIYIGLGLNYILAMIMLIPLQYCLGDPAIAIVGIVSAIAFNVTTAFADSKDLYFWGLAVGTFMIIPKPIIRSIASRRAEPTRQGALFAGFLAAELLSEVISEMVFRLVYAHHRGPVNGTIFFFIGGALCIALAHAIYLRDIMKKETSLERYALNEGTPINSLTN